MVSNMDETKLRSVAQLREFLEVTPDIAFTRIARTAQNERYAHISRVLKRFIARDPNGTWC